MASASHLVGCVALAALAYFVALAIYNVYLHPLAKMPGPKLYAISPWFQIRHKLAGRWEHVLKTLHDEYGPAVRFAPDEVSFITIDSWKAIYGHRAHGQEPLVKDTNFFFHDQGAASHIMNADIEGHRRMRRVIAHAFSEKALRGQESVIKHYVDLFINNMKAKAALGDPINIVRWFNFTTFDVIGDLSFGKSFGMLESGAYHPWIAMIFDTLGVIPFVQLISRYPVLKPIAALFTPKQQAEGRAQHLALSRETTIERIRSGGQDRQDFMSYILRNNNSDNEKSSSLTLTEDEMVENANILILAGSETTATLLSGTTFHLLSNPATYDKLVAEIRGVFTCEDDITITSTTNLEYLAAVFNETFRMYPPAPTGSPRRVPTGGMTIEGYFLPAKTSTSVHQWSAYQSAYNFYEPQSFLPERWLASVNTTDPRFVHDKRDVLQPFLTGPTLCIGKNLAYAEIRLILCRLLFSFDLELQAESKRWADQRIMALWEKGDLMVKLTAVNR